MLVGTVRSEEDSGVLQLTDAAAIEGNLRQYKTKRGPTPLHNPKRHFVGSKIILTVP